MNERIRELFLQAGLKFPSETGLSPMEQKFAQLIVRECATWLETTVVECELAGELLEHFGVEE